MAVEVKSGFYNARIVDGKPDRTYNADEISEMFEGLISDGVHESVGDAMQVKAKEGMTVQILTGRAKTGKRWAKIEKIGDLQLNPAHVTLNRYTAIILRADETARENYVIAVDSPASTEPKVPEVTRNAQVQDYMLAYVYVKAGTTEITQSMITDTRLDNERCGIVTGLVDQVKTSELFRQYQTAYEEDRTQRQQDFDEWFESVRDKLGTAIPVKAYESTYQATEADQKSIQIGIAQFLHGADILHVYINGFKLVEGMDYEVKSNTEITLTYGVDAGTLVAFECIKSVET